MYTSDYIYVYLLLLFLLFVFPLTRTDRCWLRTFFSPRFLTRSLSVLHLTWRALTAESCQPFPSNGRILVLSSPDSGFGTSILVASCGPWSAVSCPPILRDRVCLDRGPDARTVVVSGLLDSWVNWTPLRNIFSKIFEWAEVSLLFLFVVLYFSSSYSNIIIINNYMARCRQDVYIQIITLKLHIISPLNLLSINFISYNLDRRTIRYKYRI